MIRNIRKIKQIRQLFINSRRLPKIDRPITLIFAPDALLKPHLHNLCIVGRALQDEGHDVVVLRCFECFDSCPPVYNQITQAFDGRIDTCPPCEKCAHNALKLTDQYDLKSINMRSFITDEEIAEVRRSVEELPIAEMSYSDFDELHSGAFIDLPIVFKALGFSFGSDDRLDFLRRTISSVQVCNKALENLIARVPVDRAVVYGIYALQTTARKTFEQMGIPCYEILNPGHKNIDWQKLIVIPEDWATHAIHRINEWESWADLPVPASTVVEIGDDLVIRLKADGKRIYSPGRSENAITPENFGLTRDRKTIACFTSSPDEFESLGALYKCLGREVSGSRNCFPDQIAWLQHMIQEVEDSNDLQLIVRIHPREGATRNCHISDHFYLLNEAFGDREYKHVRIVWPEDPESSYDIGEIADVVCVAWTTMALEFARMGLPVIAAFERNMLAPADVWLTYPRTAESFMSDLRATLEQAASLERVRQAFRWYNFSNLGYSIDLSDVVEDQKIAGTHKYKKPAHAIDLKRVIINGEHIEKINQERLQMVNSRISCVVEEDAILCQMARLLLLLMTGKDLSLDNPDLVRRMREVEARHLSFDTKASTVTIEIRKGQSITKFSPMAVKIAQILTSSFSRVPLPTLTGNIHQ